MLVFSILNGDQYIFMLLWNKNVNLINARLLSSYKDLLGLFSTYIPSQVVWLDCVLLLKCDTIYGDIEEFFLVYSLFSQGLFDFSHQAFLMVFDK